MTGLPLRAHAYVAVLAVLAAGVVLLRPLLPGFDPLTDAIVVLSALNVVSAALRVRSPDVERSIAVTSIVYLAAIPLVGVWGAVVVAVAGDALHPGRTPLVVRTFNASQHGLAALCAGLAYLACGGTMRLDQLDRPNLLLTVVLLPLLIANIVQCLVNAVLTAGIISLHKGATFAPALDGMLRSGAISYVGYGLFGLLLAVLWDGAGIGPLSAVLVLAPLYIARWAWAQYDDERQSYDRTVRALVRAVETKDLYTRGHSERVATASVMIARQLQMGPDRIENLRLAGILHDIGKLGVPTRLLRKNGPLTDQEFEAIALHPVRGLEMVRDIEFFGEALPGILHHHERVDGRGYPMGLRGNDIPEFARVIAVADAFDSMTTTRSYRKACSVQEAVTELRACAGAQFEPRLVEALAAALRKDSWAVGPNELVPGPRVLAQGLPVGFDHDDPASSLPPGAARDADHRRTETQPEASASGSQVPGSESSGPQPSGPQPSGPQSSGPQPGSLL